MNIKDTIHGDGKFRSFEEWFKILNGQIAVKRLMKELADK